MYFGDHRAAGRNSWLSRLHRLDDLGSRHRTGDFQNQVLAAEQKIKSQSIWRLSGRVRLPQGPESKFPRGLLARLRVGPRSAALPLESGLSGSRDMLLERYRTKYRGSRPASAAAQRHSVHDNLPYWCGRHPFLTPLPKAPGESLNYFGSKRLTWTMSVVFIVYAEACFYMLTRTCGITVLSCSKADTCLA
jgi:hypothetical protein